MYVYVSSHHILSLYSFFTSCRRKCCLKVLFRAHAAPRTGGCTGPAPRHSFSQSMSQSFGRIYWRRPAFRFLIMSVMASPSVSFRR